MIGWYRKRGLKHEAPDADPDWGRFADDDDYEGWEGFYIPDPGRCRPRGVVRVLQGRDRWNSSRATKRAKS